MKTTIFKFTRIKFALLVSVLVFSSALFSATQAQSTRTLSTPDPTTNINDSGFRLIVCDGPVLPTTAMITTAEAKLGHKYVPCDFNGMMLQIQHMINIFIVLGVVVAVAGMIYAGFLLISGTPANIGKAKDIFPKIIIGFIIMLSAWFVVYQILDWLTGNSGFSALLGSP